MTANGHFGRFLLCAALLLSKCLLDWRKFISQWVENNIFTYDDIVMMWVLNSSIESCERKQLLVRQREKNIEMSWKRRNKYVETRMAIRINHFKFA